MATPEKKIPEGIIVTPPFRLAFASVFTPKPNKDPNKKARYEITMIFPPDADLSGLKGIIKKCVETKFPDPNKRPKGLRNPIRDGNDVDYDGFAGNMFCAARSNDQPGLVDEKRQPIIDPKKIYSGCWCRAAVSAWYYDKEGNRGVSIDLKHLQFLRDDEAFVKRTKPEDVFGDAETPAAKAPDGDEMFT